MRFLVYINWTADSNLQAGDTAAHIAASRGDIKIVEALHDAGANLHLYNNVSKPFRFCSNVFSSLCVHRRAFDLLKLLGEKDTWR